MTAPANPAKDRRRCTEDESMLEPKYSTPNAATPLERAARRAVEVAGMLTYCRAPGCSKSGAVQCDPCRVGDRARLYESIAELGLALSRVRA
jgi:hypothetical protein